MGSIVLYEHIIEFFSMAENPSEDITPRPFGINMKGSNTTYLTPAVALYF
jgi:hypothetical protein